MVKELLTLLEYWMRIQEGTLIEVHMNVTHEAEGDAEHFVGQPPPSRILSEGGC